MALRWATRTQGFWSTHTPLANIAWFGGTAFGHTFPGVAGTSGIGDEQDLVVFFGHKPFDQHAARTALHARCADAGGRGQHRVSARAARARRQRFGHDQRARRAVLGQRRGAARGATVQRERTAARQQDEARKMWRKPN